MGLAPRIKAIKTPIIMNNTSKPTAISIKLLVRLSEEKFKITMTAIAMIITAPTAIKAIISRSLGITILET